MADTKPPTTNKGTAGPAPMKQPMRMDSNGMRAPRSTPQEFAQPSFKNGTAGRKTWPKLPK